MAYHSLNFVSLLYCMYVLYIQCIMNTLQSLRLKSPLLFNPSRRNLPTATPPKESARNELQQHKMESVNSVSKTSECSSLLPAAV